jgi:hypothetical protein
MARRGRVRMRERESISGRAGVVQMPFKMGFCWVAAWGWGKSGHGEEQAAVVVEEEEEEEEACVAL